MAGLVVEWRERNGGRVADAEVNAMRTQGARLLAYVSPEGVGHCGRILSGTV
jgi:hypothetical protein